LRVLDEQVRVELLAAGNASEFVRRYSSPSADVKYFPVSHYIEELAEMLRPLPPPARITVPMLVLLSRGLTYTHSDVTARILAGASDASCQTIDAYHWPLTEQPTEVRRIIEAWVAQHLPAPTP
jgi:pimeloyl-ACP methyl ester carboxylesterase